MSAACIISLYGGASVSGRFRLALSISRNRVCSVKKYARALPIIDAEVAGVVSR